MNLCHLLVRVVSLSACTKAYFRYSITMLLFCVTFAGTSSVESQEKRNEAPSSADSLKKFLQTLDNDKATRYIVAFEDLNDDGSPEAIVYMLGVQWCGSGGCDTLILGQRGRSWKMVTDVSITSPPVRVLPSTSKGWHNLGIWVGGGGIQTGYEVELTFDGKTYPENPTIRPARRLKKKTSGKVVIPSAEHGMLLHE